MKPEIEFTSTAEVASALCAGNVPGLTEAILARDEDHEVVTRILSFEPGTDTTPNGVQVHDTWEEVFIFEGSFTDVTLQQTFTAPAYACRPPGMPHGPWISTDGARMFEVRYRRDPRTKDVIESSPGR